MAPSISSSTTATILAEVFNSTPVKTAEADGQSAIVDSTCEVFRRMLQWDIELIGHSSFKADEAQTGCCGIIGLSGAARGSVVVNMAGEVAIGAAEAFLGAPPSHVDADVIDTVGELTNMIGGSSKDRLGVDGLSLGLPTVVVGCNQSIAFDPGAQIEAFLFSTPFGNFSVEIALRPLQSKSV